MFGLITDRSQWNVDRLKELSAKGWNNMTPAEQAEWSGDPMLANGGANLIPKTENYAAGVSIKYRDDAIIATSNWDGSYVYAIMVIGPAAKYEGKTFTFSLDSFYSSGGGTPQAALYWHDANGYEFAGASLSDAGSVTFTITENTGARENLALYLYATTDASITAGAFIRYERLMLELGDTRHEYVPYYAILPTTATKGAYNYSDMNRVETAVAELADMAGMVLETKTNWTVWDIPKEADLSRYLGNIAALRSRFPIPDEYPETPTSMNHLTYTVANNIERIVLAIAEAMENSIHSGEIYSGEIS